MNYLLPNYTIKGIQHGFSATTSYVSLINPFVLSNYSFESYRRFSHLKPNEKIYVKQSYMILTWFHYLTLLTAKTDWIKTKNNSSLRFYMAPKVHKKFTITKAPIAHKTRSKEQILFTFFRFTISFHLYTNLTDLTSKIQSFFFYTSCDQALLSILLTKNSISLSETNLLFLKKKKISIKFIDPIYFSYVV